jgi:hypothetical protein
MWSNEQQHPTLSRINRAFACMVWSDLYPNHVFQALPTIASDHAPLILHIDVAVSSKSRFRFQAFWPKFSGYLDAVSRG